jgi:hypothetical protein
MYGQPPPYDEPAPPMGTPVRIQQRQPWQEEFNIMDIIYDRKVSYPSEVTCWNEGESWVHNGGVGLDLCKGTVRGKDLFDKNGISKVLKLSDVLFPASGETNIWDTEGKNAFEKLSNFLSVETDLGIQRRKKLLEAEWILTARDEIIAKANRELRRDEQHLRKPEDIPVMNLWILSFILHNSGNDKTIRVLNCPDFRRAEREVLELLGPDARRNHKSAITRVKFTDITALRQKVALEVAPDLAKKGLMFKTEEEALWMNPRTVVMMCRGGAISEEEREAASAFGSLVIDVRLHTGKYQNLRKDRFGKVIEDQNYRSHHRLTDEEFDQSALHMLNQFCDTKEFIKRTFKDKAPFAVGKIMLSMDEHSGQAIFAAVAYSGLGIASRASVLQYFQGSFTEFPVLIS